MIIGIVTKVINHDDGTVSVELDRDDGTKVEIMKMRPMRPTRIATQTTETLGSIAIGAEINIKLFDGAD